MAAPPFWSGAVIRAWALTGMTSLPSASGLLQVRLGRLGAAGQRGAVGLAAPDDVLLLLERELLPVVEEHADAAYDGVGAARHPRRAPAPDAGTKIRWSKSGSDGFGLRVPSIWPIRLRAVMGWAVAPGERLKPFICQRTRAASPASFWIARSAWKATSASLAPICTHRSPLLRCLVEVVGGEVGQRVEGVRALLLQARAGEEAVPEAEGDGQGRRARVARDIRVVAARPPRPPSAAGPSPTSGAAARRPPCGPRPAARSKATRWPRAWRAVVMPGLMFPVEHHLGRRRAS